MTDSAAHRQLAAIMFTDMVGYTTLMQRNEKLALELLEEHRRVLREWFPKFHGREIGTTVHLRTAHRCHLRPAARRSAIHRTAGGNETAEAVTHANQVS